MIRGVIAQYLQLLGIVDADVLELPPTLGSIIYYLLNIVLCRILFYFNSFIPKPFHIYFGEFICTLQICAASLENGNIYKLHGLTGLFIVLCIFGVVNWYILPEWCSPNPVSHVKKLVEQLISKEECVLRIVIQIVAGLAAYEYARSIWYFEIHDYHRLKLSQVGCISGLTVSVGTGFLVEGSATLIDNWIQSQKLSKYPLLDVTVKTVLASYMVTLGVHMTGIFYNPAMASCHFLGCDGNSFIEHFIVYWLGPLCGVSLSVYLNRYLHLPHGGSGTTEVVQYDVKLNGNKDTVLTNGSEGIIRNGYHTNGVIKSCDVTETTVKQRTVKFKI